MIGKDLVVDVMVDVLRVDQQAIYIEDAGTNRFVRWPLRHCLMQQKYSLMIHRELNYQR